MKLCPQQVCETKLIVKTKMCRKMWFQIIKNHFFSVKASNKLYCSFTIEIKYLMCECFMLFRFNYPSQNPYNIVHFYIFIQQVIAVVHSNISV